MNACPFSHFVAESVARIDKPNVETRYLRAAARAGDDKRRAINLYARKHIVVYKGTRQFSVLPHRKEVTKAGKWYFYDNGIRNAIIGAFSPLAIRQDVGALWENYIIGERRKANFNEGLHKEFYFWRTYDKQEIDLIEENPNNLTALEFKCACFICHMARRILITFKSQLSRNHKMPSSRYFF